MKSMRKFLKMSDKEFEKEHDFHALLTKKIQQQV